GSRSREVRKIFPAMLDATAEIIRKRPATRFEAAAPSETLARELEVFVGRSSLKAHGRVVTGDSSGSMQRAFAGMVASGTATLEAAYLRLPLVFVYNVSCTTYLSARL